MWRIIINSLKKILFVVFCFFTLTGYSQSTTGTTPLFQYQLHSPDEVNDLYRNSGYRRVWTQPENVSQLIASLRGAEDEGLFREDYHYDTLLSLLDLNASNGDLSTDAFFTDAWITLAKNLKEGKLKPALLFPAEWDPSFNEADYALILLQALNDRNISGALETLKPSNPLYCRLKDELKMVRRINSDSLSGYYDQLIVNLEKCRWQAERQRSQIAINIPSYSLQLLFGDSCLMEMKAIVGRPERKTPIVSSSISSLVLNPEWTVPPTILKEDMLPSIQKNVNYLSKNNLRIVDHDGIDISADSLPWNKYTADNFPYIIKQYPGIRNSLGLIKFYFPNRHGVYLHDTNAHFLFAQDNRALSSGCIRVERPFGLANELLPLEWTEQRVQDSVRTGHTITVALRPRIQIQTTYFTLHLNGKGELRNVHDIYGWDAAIAEALNLKKRKQSCNPSQDRK